MVDLEQFREAVEYWRVSVQQPRPHVTNERGHYERVERMAEADRLLSIIDSAGEVGTRLADLEQQARELLAAEWANESSGASCTDITNELKAELVALRAIVAALRQQHAAVVGDACKVIVTRDNDHEIIKVEVNGEIVAETIHAGGKRHSVEPDKSATLNSHDGKCPCGEATCTESWEPGCGLGSSKDHAAVSEVTRQLIERDRQGRVKYGTSLDRTDLSISEWLQHMAEELLDGAGYALAAKRAVEQPWVVVDEAMVERAWRAGAAEYARINNGLLDDSGEDDIAAMRAALTAALSSAPGVGNG